MFYHVMNSLMDLEIQGNDKKNSYQNSLNNLQDIKNHLNTFRNELKDPNSFKKFYSFVFDYSKQPDQKSLGVQIAIPTWKLVLKDYPLLEKWCTFIEQVYQKSISKDLWLQFLEFVRNIGTDFTKHSEQDSWYFFLLNND